MTLRKIKRAAIIVAATSGAFCWFLVARLLWVTGISIYDSLFWLSCWVFCLALIVFCICLFLTDRKN